MPVRLKRQKTFRPCLVADGDERFAVGLFEFNITRLLTLIEARPNRFPVGSIAVADIPNYDDSRRNPEAVRTADLSRSVLLSESARRRYTLIDRYHRIARARSDAVPTVPAHRLPCLDHLAFLTSARAYECYVEYWNSKLEDECPRTASRRRRRA